MPTTLLALDAGTTGVTGLLFDEALQPLARAAREFPQSYPRPGEVEHRAGDILAAVDAVLGELLVLPEARHLVAIGLTNQRETVFALECGSGHALRPGIVWQDRRTAARCGELRDLGHGDLVRRRTGLRCDPYFSATKIEWMLREDANLRRRARAGEVVFATVDALVLHHLTGGAVWATDPTNASRTMLFDVNEGRWDGELCALFGVDPAWLPEVRASSGDFGSTLPARTGGRSLAVRGVAGDQQAALFGQGCFTAGTFKVTYGTGSFLLLHTGAERTNSRRGLLTTRAATADGASAFAMEGSVFISGALVQFLRDQLGFIETAADVEALAREADDAGGIHVVPAFTGLGAPHWDPEARGAILGLTRGSTAAEIARAALEAIALQNAELIEILRAESGLEIASLLADGGAARNDLLMQMQADFAGLEVVRPTEVEATARGAAALAGCGGGLWADPPGRGADDPRTTTRFTSGLGEAERRDRLVGWRAAVERVLAR